MNSHQLITPWPLRICVELPLCMSWVIPRMNPFSRSVASKTNTQAAKCWKDSIGSIESASCQLPTATWNTRNPAGCIVSRCSLVVQLKQQACYSAGILLSLSLILKLIMQLDDSHVIRIWNARCELPAWFCLRQNRKHKKLPVSIPRMSMFQPASLVEPQELVIREDFNWFPELIIAAHGLMEIYFLKNWLVKNETNSCVVITELISDTMTNRRICHLIFNQSYGRFNQ